MFRLLLSQKGDLRVKKSQSMGIHSIPSAKISSQII